MPTPQDDVSPTQEPSEEAKGYLQQLSNLPFSLELLGEYPRAIGELAASTGEGQLLLLGMLDGGLSLDDVIEALVMHGKLPSWLETDHPGILTLKFNEHADNWEPALPESV